MSRFDRIAAKLKDYDLDAMLITGEANRLYAAGFHSTAGVALVTGEKSWFFIDSRYIEAARKNITGAEVGESSRENPYHKLVGERLARYGLKRVGVEDTYMTVAELERWKKKLEGVEFVPASKLLTELRGVKDGEEIACMVSAQRIAERALGEVLDFIRVGRTDREVAAFLQYKMLSFGAERVSFEPIVVSGANSSMPHGVPTDKPVAAGDFLTMDFGCVKGGYCSDMTRTVAVGHVTEEMEKVYRTVLAAQKAGIATAKAGVKGQEIHNAAAEVIAGAGYGEYFGHGFGHGVGVEVHEGAGAGPASEQPLPAGAVISAEPGIYLPGRFGVRIEDVVVIEEGGCRDLMEAPKELLVL